MRHLPRLLINYDIVTKSFNQLVSHVPTKQKYYLELYRRCTYLQIKDEIIPAGDSKIFQTCFISTLSMPELTQLKQWYQFRASSEVQLNVKSKTIQHSTSKRLQRSYLGFFLADVKTTKIEKIFNSLDESPYTCKKSRQSIKSFHS